MKSKYHYIRSEGIREAAKENGKQVSQDFLQALDRIVFSLVIKACKMNGNNSKLVAGLIE
jgi:hypothetical protein